MEYGTPGDRADEGPWMMTTLEIVARAIYLKFEDRPAYAQLQMNGILADELARAAIEAIMKPSAEVIEAGIVEAENCKDSDWDSGPDGEQHNSYEYLRSDAPATIFKAMLQAILQGK